MQAFKDHPNIELKTSMDPQFGGAIGLFKIKSMDVSSLYRYLINEKRIHTSPIRWENISGVRVTPNVYTNFEELDRFVTAVLAVA